MYKKKLDQSIYDKTWSIDVKKKMSIILEKENFN